MDIRKYFQKGSFGFLELIIVLYPILKQYNAPIISVGDWLLYAAGFICMFKPRPMYKCKPLLLLIGYIILHEIVVAFAIGGAPSYMINGTIDRILPLFLLMWIVPYADYEKVKHGFYVVGAICMVGLVYHFILIYAFGRSVSPITLPFLEMSNMLNEDYVSQYRIRPISFFPEPAAYAYYMLFPLAISLMEKNTRYALIISFVTLLSTSSNGYFQTGAMWLVYLLLDRNMKGFYRFFMIGVILVGVYFVSTSGLFDSGIEKIQNTEFNNDQRVTAGLYTFMNLPIGEKVFGVMNATPFDYISTHIDVVKGVNISMTDTTVFLPMIWFYGIKYGIIGMALVLLSLFSGWKTEGLKYLIVACTLSIFVQSTTLIMPMFVIMLVMRRKTLLNKQTV